MSWPLDTDVKWHRFLSLSVKHKTVDIITLSFTSTMGQLFNVCSLLVKFRIKYASLEFEILILRPKEISNLVLFILLV